MAIPTKMKTVVRDGYGGPEGLRIEEVAIPVPKPNQVLVKVDCTTVNRTDCGGMRGEPFIYRFFVGMPNPRNRATGTDFAGMIVKVGSNVKGFNVGDRVFGFDDNALPTHAEYATINANKKLHKIPENVSFADAVASIEGGHYAINFINKLELKPGMKVLVYGATGAIGSSATQLLIHQGIEVVAVCHSKDVALVEALGPKRVLAYDQEGLTQAGGEFDAVFDAVGKSTFGACKPLLKANGAYISSELGPGNENLYLPILTKLRGGKRVLFPFPSGVDVSLNKMASVLQEGVFKPMIDRRFQLEQIKEAFTYVESGQKLGSVILRVAT